MIFMNVEPVYDKDRYLKYFSERSIDNFYKANLSHLREQYLIYLNSAQKKPEFSLLQTLKLFQQCLQDDPILLAQVLTDYEQMEGLGVENPFHVDYWLNKNTHKVT